MKKIKSLDKIFYIIGSIVLIYMATIVFAGNASDASKIVLADKGPNIIYQDRRNLQDVVDAASPYSIIVCNPNEQMTISTPVVITKPLTLQGINARLPNNLGKTPILEVKSENVTITNFVLRGNNDTVNQKERAPLVIIRAGNFRLEGGLFENSSKDGVMVVPLDKDLVGGVIKDIVGKNVVRDVISLAGNAENTHLKVRNILVENVRGYDSSSRGVVEISNGTSQVTVNKVYAENCAYAIDIQDHGKQEINDNIVINDVYAFNCRHAIRTQNNPFGHTNVTISNVTAEECQQALKVSNTDHVTIENIRIIDNKGQNAFMNIKNCDGLIIRDVTIVNGTSNIAGLLVENCSSVLVDGVSLLGETQNMASGVRFHISENAVFSNLRIRNVSAKNVRESGIILEKKNANGGLENYIISENIGTVSDLIGGTNGSVINNI